MKRTHIIALVFIVIAIGAVISTVYHADTYASFEEARKHPGREFHIIGELIKDKPIEEKVVSNTLMMTFFMTDNQGGETRVTYFGAKPQDFEKSDQVVLIGAFEGDAFVASSLLLKCPSKYNPNEFEETTYVFSEE